MQCGGSRDLLETQRIKMSHFCEQMVSRECMLRDSVDAREKMGFNNSISSSITASIVSLMIFFHIY